MNLFKIIHNLDLDELICSSSDEYIEKVLFYASNRQELNSVKNKIHNQKQKGVFFNQEIFTKNLEKAYENILQINI